MHCSAVVAEAALTLCPVRKPSSDLSGWPDYSETFWQLLQEVLIQGWS